MMVNKTLTDFIVMTEDSDVQRRDFDRIGNLNR